MKATVSEQAVTIPAVDGFSFAGTIFEPAGERKAIIQINSATGVPKESYLKLGIYSDC